MLGAPVTFETMARHPGESEAPGLWPDYAWLPALGVQGGRLVDACGRQNLSVSGCTWESGYISKGSASAISPPTALTSGISTMVVELYPSGASIQAQTNYGARLFCDPGGTSQYREKDNGSWQTISFSLDAPSNVFVLAHDYGNRTSEVTCHNGQTLTVGLSDPVWQSYKLLDVGTLGNVLGFSRRYITGADARRLAADPLLPFRRRAVRSWFLPTGPTFNPAWVRTTHTVQAGVST